MPAPLTLSSLPLFPLDTVLYPGGVLPLRIFEVRYLNMISKCHKTGAPFGVVSLTQGAEVRKIDPASPAGDGFAAEAFNGVGTIATISALSQLQPGVLSVRCAGTQRFQIAKSEKLRHGLWIANVTCLDDDMKVRIPADLQATADALGKLIRSLQGRKLPAERMPVPMPYQLDDCGWVANRWCELLPIPVTLKQRLMELDNPLVRLELVGDILERTGIAL